MSGGVAGGSGAGLRCPGVIDATTAPFPRAAPALRCVLQWAWLSSEGGVRGRRAIIWLAQGSVPQRVPTERPVGGLGFTWQVVVLPSAA
jgi:hypothetical protein